jgi:hypothetical protein
MERRLEMETITGLYDSYDDARSVVSQLEDEGVSSDHISIVGHDEEANETYATEGAATGAGLGAVIGGGGGLLAGLGMLAIPGIGPVVAAGWLASTAAGAVAGAVAGSVAGGIVGSLTSAGVADEDAQVYAEGVRRGSTLVSVRAEGEEIAVARTIINGSNPVDVPARRALYQDEGWVEFDETRPKFTSEEAARERERIRDAGL